MWYTVFLIVIGSIARQTDWIGGPGVLGPVEAWGTQYWIRDSVTAATPGQVSLIATGWDYDKWIKQEVDNNAGISMLTQGFMPADINSDGIMDLVAHSSDQVVWYENSGNYTFTPHTIGSAPTGGSSGDTIPSCIYPCDLDKDDDIDVLVATHEVGVGWYENDNLTWTWHSLDNSTGYHRVSAVDVDLDKDLDIIAVDNSGAQGYKMCGDIYLFRNNGDQTFTKEPVADLPSHQGWRVYPVDFNADGYPDLYSVFYEAYVFLNDGTGHFNQSWHQDYWSLNADFDGAWPSDVNMDGNMDLVVGGQYNFPYAFYALLGDGTGFNFDRTLLEGTFLSEDYTDGGISCDIDLDGYPDIAGANYKVGWFRRDPENPLTYTLWPIEDLLTRSHWIYTYPMNNICTPRADLLVTREGYHILYKNQMFEAFASFGYFESSILKIPTTSNCFLKYFGHKACVPNDSSLAFYWRTALDSADVVNKPWKGPHYATTIGLNVVDSFSLESTLAGGAFQYKAEFRSAPDDIAVLHEVWLTYECSSVGIEESPVSTIHELPLQFVDGKLILYLSHKDRVQLTLYDVAGRVVKNVFKGWLSSGTHKFESPERSGIYFAKLHYTEGIRTLKFIKLE